MTYYLTIKRHNGTIIPHDAPFQTLQDALDYIFDRRYLKSPVTPLRNNAYISIGQNGISNIYMSSTTIGRTDLCRTIHSISIRNEAARMQAAKGEAKDHIAH